VTPLTAQQMRQLDSVRGDLLALAQVHVGGRPEQARADLLAASGLATDFAALPGEVVAAFAADVIAKLLAVAADLSGASLELVAGWLLTTFDPEADPS
jgi:hypothetical protein